VPTASVYQQICAYFVLISLQFFSSIEPHPHIIQYYGYCIKDESIFIVLEYMKVYFFYLYIFVESLNMVKSSNSITVINKGNVHSLVSEKQLEMRSIVKIAEDIASGMYHLHCNDVIVRYSCVNL